MAENGTPSAPGRPRGPRRRPRQDDTSTCRAAAPPPRGRGRGGREQVKAWTSRSVRSCAWQPRRHRLKACGQEGNYPRDPRKAQAKRQSVPVCKPSGEGVGAEACQGLRAELPELLSIFKSKAAQLGYAGRGRRRHEGSLPGNWQGQAFSSFAQTHSRSGIFPDGR